MKNQEIERALVDLAVQEEMDEDEREDQLEEDMESQKETGEDNMDPGEVPTPDENHTLLSFLQDILAADNRYMTANLTWEELGKPTFSTRFWLNLANMTEKLHGYSEVANYCRAKAMVTTDTSLSRDGFMVQTSVTTKKVKEKKGTSELAAFLKGRGSN